MIRVTPVPEPATFDERCRKRGKQWLTDHPDADRPEPYWGEFNEELRKAFHRRCAYLGLYIATGTCDHFLAFKGRGGHALAYEWSNYRYCDNAINSGKKPEWDGRLVDPFDVDDEWFEVLLPSCEFKILEDKVPPDLLANVQFTVEKLGLRSERITRLRSEWFQLYEEKGLPLEVLKELAPLVARAVEKKAQAAHIAQRAPTDSSNAVW